MLWLCWLHAVVSPIFYQGCAGLGTAHRTLPTNFTTLLKEGDAQNKMAWNAQPTYQKFHGSAHTALLLALSYTALPNTGTIQVLPATVPAHTNLGLPS